MRTKTARHRQDGLSLFDTLVALLISGLLLAVSFPLLASADKTRLKLSADTLRASLQRAIVRAESLNQDLRLKVTAHELRISLSADNEAVLYRPPSGASLSIGGKAREMTLYRDGIASPATIDLTQNSSHCAVIVSLRGRVRSVC